MGRRAGVRITCVRCGIPSAGFACNDCSRGCDRDMVWPGWQTRRRRTPRGLLLRSTCDSVGTHRERGQTMKRVKRQPGMPLADVLALYRAQC